MRVCGFFHPNRSNRHCRGLATAARVRRDCILPASDRPTFCGTRTLTDINETNDTSESGNDHDYY
jgi:hypothetical protein